MSSINNLVMEAQVLEALRTCYDPEIPLTSTSWDWCMK
jgi:metal-sulfur cluster biosynthetic enzyme